MSNAGRSSPTAAARLTQVDGRSLGVCKVLTALHPSERFEGFVKQGSCHGITYHLFQFAAAQADTGREATSTTFEEGRILMSVTEVRDSGREAPDFSGAAEGAVGKVAAMPEGKKVRAMALAQWCSGPPAAKLPTLSRVDVCRRGNCPQFFLAPSLTTGVGGVKASASGFSRRQWDAVSRQPAAWVPHALGRLAPAAHAAAPLPPRGVRPRFLLPAGGPRAGIVRNPL
jgi:hypothetical protein